MCHDQKIIIILVIRPEACITAKRILERLGIQTSSSSKFDRSLFLILKPISYFLVFNWLFFLSRNYWSSLDYDLMASI